MCLMSYANNKGADQPAHPRSLISAFVVRCLDSIISLFYSRNFKTLASFCGCAGRFVSGLVGNSRRQVLSCRGSYIFTISQFTFTAQSVQELYMWTEHACNGPSTCERVLYVWTGPPTDIRFSTCERDHWPRQCHKTWNSHKHFHIPGHTSPGLIIYHAMPARPYNISYYTSLLAIYHAMRARPYHISCHALQAIHIPCHAR